MIHETHFTNESFAEQSRPTTNAHLHALMHELIQVQYRQLYALDELIRVHIDSALKREKP